MTINFWHKKKSGIFCATSQTDIFGPFDNKKEMIHYIHSILNINKPKLNQLFFINGEIKF
jgi:hypothetical protein